MKDTDIQNEFRKKERQHTSNAQGEPEIDYVIWLEQELIKAREQVNKNESISLVRLSLPDSKEVDEAAESFGDLYSLDWQFANGCESGWKAGAEWMRDKVNEQIGSEA